MPQTILVTGATGYIAKHIVLKLLDAGYRVVGSARREGARAELVAALRPQLADPTALDERLGVVSLDLTRDDGWDPAMNGVDALVHTASPFPMAQPKDPAALVGPAVEGTRRALGAAARAGIGRVVMTSSTVAILGADLPDGRACYDERDWSRTEGRGVTPYARSKTLAERAAWELAGETGLRLTAINPGFVLGPPLDARFGTSIEVIRRLLSRRDPMLPPLGFATVAVEDVAEMHLRALQRPDTAGRRYVAAADFLWLREMARELDRAFPERRIVTREAPSWLVRAAALFDPAIRSILPQLGRRGAVSAERARDGMGMRFADPRESVVAAARYLVATGQA